MVDLFWMGSHTPKGEDHYKWINFFIARYFRAMDAMDLNKTERAQIRAVEDLERVSRERKRMGAQLTAPEALKISVARPGAKYYPKKVKRIRAPENSMERGNQSRSYRAGTG